MKRLFIVLCDILFLCMVVAPAAGIVWGLAAWCGWAVAEPAKNVCIAAMAGCTVFVLAAYIVWTRMNSAARGSDEEVGE